MIEGINYAKSKQVSAFASRASYQDDGVKFIDVDLTATQP